VFEQLYQLASDESKETAGKLKAYKKTDYDIIINDADSIITNNQQAITELEESEDQYQEQRIVLQTEIVQLIETKQPTTYNGPDIDELSVTESELTKKISKLQADIDTAETNLEASTQQYSIIKRDKRKYNQEELQTKLEELEQPLKLLKQFWMNSLILKMMVHGITSELMKK
jgi:chromosome segregation ATPase